MTEEKLTSIEEAVAECTALAGQHHRSARYLLFFSFFAFVIFLLLGFFYVFQNTLIRPEKPMSETFIYLILGAFIAVFGVLMATYRFHLGEASRINHAQIGFMRIRVAARNSGAAYQSEVRKALTENAFVLPETATPPLISRSKKIENPMPGHPASDLTTQLLNKVIEQLEVSIKPKDK